EAGRSGAVAQTGFCAACPEETGVSRSRYRGCNQTGVGACGAASRGGSVHRRRGRQVVSERKRSRCVLSTSVADRKTNRRTRTGVGRLDWPGEGTAQWGKSGGCFDVHGSSL